MAENKNSRSRRSGGFGVLNQPGVTVSDAVADDQVTTSTGSRYVESVDDTREERVKKFLRRNGVLIVAVGLALIVVLMATNIASSRSDTLERQRSEILSLEQSLETNTETRNADYDAVIRQATGGIDATHRREDLEAAEGLFRDALTWEDMPEYLDKRESVMRRHNLSEDSSFMRSFMPGEIEGVARTTPGGETYYANDADINSRYEGVDAVVTGVNGDVYSYWTLVSMRVQSDSGQTSTPMYATASFDVVDGEVVNLVADTAPLGVERTS